MSLNLKLKEYQFNIFHKNLKSKYKFCNEFLCSKSLFKSDFWSENYFWSKSDQCSKSDFMVKKMLSDQ